MTTAPTKTDLALNEVAIAIDGALDDLGRCRLTAFWLDDYLPPGGVRGQVFHTHLEDFVNGEHLDGRRVTALDEHTHKMLDGLGLVVPEKES